LRKGIAGDFFKEPAGERVHIIKCG
jgi:hypothetical protein